MLLCDQQMKWVSPAPSHERKSQWATGCSQEVQKVVWQSVGTRHPEVNQELLDYMGDTFKWEVKGDGLCTYPVGLERVRKMPVQVI